MEPPRRPAIGGHKGHGTCEVVRTSRRRRGAPRVAGVLVFQIPAKGSRMKLGSLVPLLVAPLLLFGARTASAQQGRLPWVAPAPPPIVEGLKLGASRQTIDSLLGKPDRVEEIEAGSVRLTYTSRGIELAYSGSDGLTSIHLSLRNSGDIGGVRVGDTRASVLGRWGRPTNDQADRCLYIVGGWGILVRFDAGGSLVSGLVIRTLPTGK